MEIKKTVIIFDLFGTVLDDVDVDFDRGLKIFWENHFKSACTFEEMQDYGQELFVKMREVQKDNREFSFAKDEVPLYCKKFGVPLFDVSFDEEWAFAEAVNIEEIRPETKAALDSFKAAGIPMYILSNCILRADSIIRLLKKYGADSYFLKVFSSADFEKRKPSVDFFNFAIDYVLKENPSCTKEDIFYIGDSYKYDAVGGTSAGLKTFWLNKSGSENVDNLPVVEVKMITEAAEKIYTCIENRYKYK